MNNLKLGRIIVLGSVVDPQGVLKGEHSAVVLTSEHELQAGEPLLAVVISSQLKNMKEDQIVRLRHGKPGEPHPQTGFTRPSAAICHWVVEVESDNIIRVGSMVWGDCLADIISRTDMAKKAKQADRPD